MAAPNIVGINTMIGVTTSVLLADTNATTIVNNVVDSQKVFKINTIMVANVDGTNAADITVALHPLDDGGGTGVKIANTISVAADSTLVLTDRASAFYILENQSIVATASAANDLAITISFDEIED
jgi:hypothetical protein